MFADLFFSRGTWQDEINEEDIFGEVPLYKALTKGYQGFVERLVLSGARLDIEIPGEYSLNTLLCMKANKATVLHIHEGREDQLDGGMGVIDCLLYASLQQTPQVMTRLHWLFKQVWKQDINGVQVGLESYEYNEASEYGLGEAEYTYYTVLDIAIQSMNIDLLNVYFRLGGSIHNGCTDYVGIMRKIKQELSLESDLVGTAELARLDRVKAIKRVLVRKYNQELRGSAK